MGNSEIQQKPHYKILVIGMSGSGKTTTINMLVNQAMSIKYREERKIAITQIVELVQANREIVPYTLKNNIKKYSPFQSDRLKQSSDSQTTKCNIYEINKEDYDISFIDTPGLGDSGGSEVDKKNIGHIIHYVQQNLGISCILYVHRSTEARKSFAFSYYCNLLKNILPDQFQDNFIVCFTNVMSPYRIAATDVLIEQGVPLDRIIYLENDCLIPINLMPFTNPKDKEQYMKRSELFWIRNKEYFNSLIVYLQKMSQSQQGQYTTAKQGQQLSKDKVQKLDTIYEQQQSINKEQQLLISKNQQSVINKELELSYTILALMKMIQIRISNAEKYQKQYFIILDSKNKKNNLLDSLPPSYYWSLRVKVRSFQTQFYQRQLEKQQAPVIFCYVCLQKCQKKITAQELFENKSMNTGKFQIFCEQKCQKCSHHTIFHSLTDETLEDVMIQFGNNSTKWETSHTLMQSIKSHIHQLNETKDIIQRELFKVFELEQEMNKYADIHLLKGQIMKEYLQYFLKKTQEDKQLPELLKNERINQLNYLKGLQEKKSQLLSSIGGSCQQPLPILNEQLAQQLREEILRLKKQKNIHEAIFKGQMNQNSRIQFV